MDQRQFLEELAHLLQDIPEEERDEALEYYRCYFEDAGIENEASVLEELGSPQQVADSLKRGIDQPADAGEYTENGYQTVDEKQVPMVAHPSAIPFFFGNQLLMICWVDTRFSAFENAVRSTTARPYVTNACT